MSEGRHTRYTCKLKPTSDQEWLLAETLWRCRTLYNTALEERITAYRRCGVTLIAYQQRADLKDLRAEMPEYADIHSQVLQDGLAWLDKTYSEKMCRSAPSSTPGACAGRQVIAVPAQSTSQVCSGCGERIPQSLCVRTHVCASCSRVLDRDEHAARKIQWAGQALRGVVA